jgi:phosphodiesterase/alkaline phosphatase D-like protein
MKAGPLATAAVMAAALCAFPAGAQAARGFTLGVAAGEVTDDSAVVWAHADKSGSGTVAVYTDRGGHREATVKRVKATSSNDNTVQAEVTRLRPDSVYRFVFTIGRNKSDTGTFRTAPAANKAKTIEFAWSGDTDAQNRQGETKPFWNNFEIYGRMAREKNAFNVNFGDTIYSDTEVGSEQQGGNFQPGAPTALSVKDKWAKYKMNLALRNLQRLRGTGVVYTHWDDHEFINDFSVAENGSKLYRDGVRAFTDYSPASWSSRDGLYRKFRWGKNLEVFFLDERSFRDAKASQGGTCDNPAGSGSPDLAPTAPQSTRNLFGVLVPSLRNPPPSACTARINDPSRTFLGKRQLAAFKRDVKRSKATFKVIMNETPIQQFYALPYDRWEGYEPERQEVLSFLRDNVKNVVFLTTDTHANFINDARLKTLEEGGPVNSGITEVVTGPVATKNFGAEIDDATGQPGSGKAVRDLFLKPQPPNGVGMQCSIVDQFSYGQVKVTSRKLTITPKDSAGRQLKEPEGNPCGPVTIAAK